MTGELLTYTGVAVAGGWRDGSVAEWRAGKTSPRALKMAGPRNE